MIAFQLEGVYLSVYQHCLFYLVLTLVASLGSIIRGCLMLLLKFARSDTNTSMLIKEEVRKVVSKGKAAGVLRLVFHDAGTFEMDGNSGGMNGSIVYELERPENAGLKKSLKACTQFSTKQRVKWMQYNKIFPLLVSWADMIAVAGAEAVSVCGGPTIPVQLGRLDSLEPDAEGKLPPESLDAPGLKQNFKRKGLSTQELVVLSGAHTLGSKGFGSPFVFDNSYYKILLEKPWKSSGGMSSMIGLPSDHALVEDDECLRFAIFKDLSIKACYLLSLVCVVSLLCKAVLSCTLDE
ncbi:hypothetical protein POTOM_026433 [Populus tomentosa]|uniref:Plant heme peroxidase family profile domain-containing protein n=1 Tax=Populus tomentosa TaxID=118781 RepID=A0A8X7ZMU9_POPTO|nr:hypothetical protein POTOM_026433 [Populus tomentosa]